MEKIPTVFERVYKNHNVVDITDRFTPGCEEPFLYGDATVKYDGSCCAIIDGQFYKRYDAKKGKKPPEGSIPCQPLPDSITGHWPHWVKVDEGNPADKWFVEALRNSTQAPEEWSGITLVHVIDYGTYEAVGPHFQGNPYNLPDDILMPHGSKILDDVPRDFEGIREYLRTFPEEGIVFWYNGKPACKIKRVDFGYTWPLREWDINNKE